MTSTAVRATYQWNKAADVFGGRPGHFDLYLRHDDYPNMRVALHAWKVDEDGKWAARCEAIHDGHNLNLRKFGFRTLRQAKVWAEHATEPALAALATWEPMRQRQDQEMKDLKEAHAAEQRAFQEIVLRKVKVRRG